MRLNQQLNEVELDLGLGVENLNSQTLKKKEKLLSVLECDQNDERYEPLCRLELDNENRCTV